MFPDLAAYNNVSIKFWASFFKIYAYNYKKILAFILSLIFVLSIAACSSEDTNSSAQEAQTSEISTDDTSASDTEICQHVYKEEFYKEAGYGVDGIMIKVCTICTESEMLPTPALPEIFELKVLDKTVTSLENECYVLFDIEIKNIADKKIESISGKISIMPPDCILELVCDFDDLAWNHMKPK